MYDFARTISYPFAKHISVDLSAGLAQLLYHPTYFFGRLVDGVGLLLLVPRRPVHIGFAWKRLDQFGHLPDAARARDL